MRLCGVAPPSPEALYAVRAILGNPHVGPLTTKGIYYRALQIKHDELDSLSTSKKQSRGVETPKAATKLAFVSKTHAIRSKTYLKESVLYFLQRRNEIEKFHLYRKATPKERSRMLQALREKTPTAKPSDVPENIDQWVWRPTGQIQRVD